MAMLEIHEELTSEEARYVRCYLRRLIGGALVLFVVGCTVIWATKANAEQLNEQGCVYVADLAITARALSAAGLERTLADKIIASMYTSDAPLAQKIRAKVTDLAYQSKLSPKDFSDFMHGACYGAKGETDKFLGVDA